MRRLCFSFIGFIALLAPARAETIVRSVYQADFLHLPVSRSFVTMTLDGKAYRIEGNGRSSPVTSILVPMRATFEAKGAFAPGAVQPETFEAHILAGKDNYDITLQMKNGGIVQESAVPQPEHKPDFVPMTEEMKRSVIDPLSAFLVPYDAKAPQKACERTLPLYTGRERFDLKFAPSRREKVSIPGFYEGEAQVCAVRYKPLGGYRAEKKEIKYMIGNRDMEVWFIPLPNVPLMGLYRAEIGTRLGPLTVVLEKAALGPKKKP